MRRDEAIAILEMLRDKAIDTILILAEKAEKYDQICGEVSPTTPYGMTPVYLKPNHSKRKNGLAGRKGIKAYPVRALRRQITTKSIL